MHPTIMIVEDEELIVLFIREILELAGFRVVAFVEGTPALTYLQVHKIDCAILDVGLPDMAGDMLVQHIRTRCQNLPIILSTGYSQAPYQQAFGNDPWLRIVAKPYNETRLLLEVEKLMLTQTDVLTSG